MKTIIGSLDRIAAALRRKSARSPKNDVRVKTEIEALDRIASAIAENGTANRVISLTETECIGNSIVEVVGIPGYVSDVTQYADYGITRTGWYVFARITAMDDVKVTAATTVEGAAGHIAQQGQNHIDVAVWFGVAAESQKVTVNWGPYTDTIVFRAVDLAVRNLDYRTTFYIYDLAPFVTWSYGPTTDSTFVDGKAYFLKNGDEFQAAEVETKAYILTEDETFASGKTYYVEIEGEYTPAEVTVGESVPANTYYEQTTVPVPPIYYVDRYTLTEDAAFVEGKTYYTESGGVYTAAEVTPGEEIPADTYYEHAYALTEDAAFVEGKTYYTLSGTTYSEAEVTPGEALPTVYYVHSRLHIEGMARNITYQLDTPVDCPSEIVLPPIEDDGYGAWYEMRFRHTGEFSSTLLPEDSDVKIATEHTQAETAGMNMVDLHYMSVGGVKIWRFLNTHATIPT